MPKDYSKSKIYKLETICESDEGDVYIGSTTQNYISHRLAEHVRGYNNWKNRKYPFVSSYALFEKYGIDNVRIILLESCPCTSNAELRAREAYYQKSMKCINKNIAFRTKEELLEYFNKYREEHRDDLLEYSNKYREEHRDERLEYFKQYSKQYYEEHKQELSEKGKEKITCECGRELRKYGLHRHQNSDIHKDLMLQLHEVENKNDAI